jgi:hypothetical protein
MDVITAWVFVLCLNDGGGCLNREARIVQGLTHEQCLFLRGFYARIPRTKTGPVLSMCISPYGIASEGTEAVELRSE